MPARCAVIDGLFIGIDLRKIGDVRFDEQFTFHFYDLDFCLSAAAAGLSIGVTNIHLQHESVGGTATPSHLAAQKLFLAKHWPA